ncbi:unnamed protein product, partial [Urochloa humidicola]
LPNRCVPPAPLPPDPVVQNPNSRPPPPAKTTATALPSSGQDSRRRPSFVRPGRPPPFLRPAVPGEARPLPSSRAGEAARGPGDGTRGRLPDEAEVRDAPARSCIRAAASSRLRKTKGIKRNHVNQKMGFWSTCQSEDGILEYMSIRRWDSGVLFCQCVSYVMKHYCLLLGMASTCSGVEELLFQ